jgi:oligopeptide/dipeptide ABC transporter ATP-binding protein
MSALLELNNLQVTYAAGARVVEAVRGISLNISRGSCVGVVGESGCGKSSLAAAALRLGVQTSGSVRFDGADVLAFGRPELRDYRRRVQVVFQDPMGALDPRQTVGEALGEVLRVQRPQIGRSVVARANRCAELMELVGLSDGFLRRYPHEMSGGQRQRVGIARALAVEPELLIADEPVSALDVSVQAQVLNLLKSLQQKLGLTLLFIAHDLAVVRYMCPEVYVMYAGLIVESGPVDEVFLRPTHPYTQALVASEPDIGRGLAGQGIMAMTDLPASGGDPRTQPGCPFAPRCSHAQARCQSERPLLADEAAAGRATACWFPASLD